MAKQQTRQITLRVSDDLYTALKSKGGERGLGKAIRTAVQRGLNAPECYCGACGAHSDHWTNTPTDVRHGEPK